MDTVRLARDIGDVSGLLPVGIERLRDIPYQLLVAIRSALTFLSFEEMREEDKPPRSIWLNNELMREHMDGLRQKYKSDEGGSGESGELGRRPGPRNDALDMLITR